MCPYTFNMTHRVTYKTADGSTRTENVSDPVYYMWEVLGDQGQASLRDRYLDQDDAARLSGWKNTVARYKALGVDIWARYRLQDGEHNFAGLSPGIPGESFKPLGPGIPSGSFKPLGPGIPKGSFEPLKPGIPSGSFRPITPVTPSPGTDKTPYFMIGGAVIVLIILYSALSS